MPHSQNKNQTGIQPLLGGITWRQNISPAGETGLSKFAPKKLYSCLKNSRQDSQGIGPLRDPHANEVLTSNTDKTNLINDHLQCVLPPYHLSESSNQLSESAILEGTLKAENIPGPFRPKVPEMPQIEGSQNCQLGLTHPRRKKAIVTRSSKRRQIRSWQQQTHLLNLHLLQTDGTHHCIKLN